MSVNFSTALSFSEREELLNLNLTGNLDSNNLMEVDDWEDMEDPEFRPPPGDEGFLQSHAGGEAILHEILDGMTPKYNFQVTRLSLHP